jgi:citrate synthase
MADKPSRGLADVIAASTAVSDIDGRAGLLFYRGYDIHQLAGPATAHVIEQHADNRLIRPDSEYIGERGLTWVPVGQR